MEKSIEAESRFKTAKQSNKMWVIAFHSKTTCECFYIYIYMCVCVTYEISETNFSPLLPTTFAPTTPQISTGSSWNLRLSPSQWSRLQQRKRNRNLHRWFSCRIVPFLSRQRSLGSTQRGMAPGPEKLAPKGWRFFGGFHFCCCFLAALDLCWEGTKGPKPANKQYPCVFFVWSLL